MDGRMNEIKMAVSSREKGLLTVTSLHPCHSVGCTQGHSLREGLRSKQCIWEMTPGSRSQRAGRKKRGGETRMRCGVATVLGHREMGFVRTC